MTETKILCTSLTVKPLDYVSGSTHLGYTHGTSNGQWSMSKSSEKAWLLKLPQESPPPCSNNCLLPISYKDQTEDQRPLFGGCLNTPWTVS